MKKQTDKNEGTAEREDIQLGQKFIPTEMGSARFAAVGGRTREQRVKTDSADPKEGTKGPPWSVEPSLKFACDEAGVDFNQFVDGLKSNKSDQEMASELGVTTITVLSLMERFYHSDVPITGNYGQD